MTNKIGVIIQARMGSSRLPGKVLTQIDEKPMLYHVVKQVKCSKLISDMVVATTTLRNDDPIEEFCTKHKIKCFRGAEDDVLDRYYKCAKKFGYDIVVRITADCPLIDPDVIDKTINFFLKNSYDYVANNLEKRYGVWQNSTCNYPQGMTVEVSSFKALEEAWKKAKKPSEREHVFPYVQFNPSIFRVMNLKRHGDLSYIRCTVDRREDLQFVREICKRLSSEEKCVRVRDIINILKKEPNLTSINNWIPFDEGYKKSLEGDRKYN